MSNSTARTADEAASVCSVCGGTGWREISNGNERRVARCGCFFRSRADNLLASARIPTRYMRCEFSSYHTEGNPALGAAKMSAVKFVEQYPIDKTGLMFIGSIGTGKTHLAVATIKELITRKGVHCLFYEYRDLLKEIQNSYDEAAQSTELQVLRPIFETEVLVLDELGAIKPSQWVWDTVSFILNTRYNDNRTTIITTNLLDEPALAASGPRSSMRTDTLGDRIGERMRSRLHEMCRTVRVQGEDYRDKFRLGGLR
ncbi:MAG TPA: ATP-binding protein [Terriglobales bacterium]|nr:ATP-binding protein [Terriglobales bacterium]